MSTHTPDPPPAPSSRLAYSTAEAQELLGVGKTTLRTLMATGRLRYTTAASRIVIPADALQAYLESPPERKVKRPGVSRRARMAAVEAHRPQPQDVPEREELDRLETIART